MLCLVLVLLYICHCLLLVLCVCARAIVCWQVLCSVLLMMFVKWLLFVVRLPLCGHLFVIIERVFCLWCVIGRWQMSGARIGPLKAFALFELQGCLL